MREPRFYAPDALRASETIDLPDDEAAHLTRVLRLSAGAQVRIFDGRGREWLARVDRAAKQAVTVTLQEPVQAVTEPAVDITLAVAVLKGDKMDEIVRDAVMLGVTAIQPLITARTEISAPAVEKSGRVARWQRIALASVKQCGRAVLPTIHDARDLGEALSVASTHVMLVEPGAEAGTLPLREVRATTRATLLVGPEGGWTPEEIGLARAAGAILMTLGALTLRADAVPVVALTALRVQWGDL